MARTYGNIARSAVEHGTAKKLTHAPAGYQSAPEYNITPKGLLGSSQSVYLIKGELYLASRPVVPNAKTTWFAVGPAPLF
jgi:hypothetical protein